MKLFISIIGLFFSIFLLSCSSKDEKQDEISNGNTRIKIKSINVAEEAVVSEINPIQDDDEDGLSKLGSSRKSSINAQAGVLLTDGSSDLQGRSEESFGEMVASTDFDALVSVAIPIVDSVKRSHYLASAKEAVASKRIVNKLAADVPINSSIKFRLIIYNENRTQQLFNKVLSRNEEPDIALDIGTFHWFAISTQETGTAPDVNSSGVINRDDLANKDFMFDSGSISTVEGDNFLEIIFLRQMAAVDVSLNTRGLFGPMQGTSSISIGSGTGATAFTSIIRTGNFNIFNGVFSDFSTVNTSVLASAMSVVDTRWGNAEKLATFYTAANAVAVTIPVNNLRLRLNSLSITLDDNSTRTFAANALLSIPHTTALSLTKGTRSRANVRLIESGIRVGNYNWARTNLIFDASKNYGSTTVPYAYTMNETDAYRLRPNNNYTSPSDNEYWFHGVPWPTSTEYRTVDACRRIFPSGTWRLPNVPSADNPTDTDHHFNALINNLVRTPAKNQIGTTTAYRYSISWTRSTSQAQNTAYPDANFVLPVYGYRTSAGVVTQNPALVSSSGQMHYWSNSWFTEQGSTYLHGLSLRGTVTNGTTSNTLSMSSNPASNRLPIRCVRRVVN
ncbi:hypothetical protein [Sphingobacterium hungaricum]